MSKKNSKRVFSSVLVAVAVLMGSVIFVSWLLERQDLSAVVRFGLVLIPVVAYIFCLGSYLRLIRLADELERRIHLEALAIAFPGSAVAVFACEYLRKGGFISQFKPDYVLLIMLSLWAVGYFIARMRFQ